MSLAEIVTGLAPGAWYEVPNTNLSAVFPPKAGHPAWGIEGPGAVVASWSGAAFDTARNVLIVTGGGHGAYGGNEIYEFDLATMTWHRVTEPSPMIPDPVRGDPYYVTTDGSRVSSHTYDGLEYIPTLKALFMWGGSQYRSGNNQDKAAYLFDLQARTWQRKSESPDYWIQPATAWDSFRNRVLVVYKTGLYAYDPATDKWDTIANGWWFQSGCTAAYSPDHDLFLRLAAESHVPAGYIDFRTSDDLKKAPLVGAVPTTRVGLTYHPPSQRFVVWDGHAVVWTIDPVTWQVVEHTAAGGPSRTDERGVEKNHGTYSRWHYVPAYGVFVGLNSSDDNVWIYRLPSVTDTPVAEPPPVEAPDLPDGPIIITDPGGINVGPSRTIRTLAEAAAQAREGDVFLLDAGEYNEGVSWPVGITLRGVGGRPKIGGTVADNKGLFVTRGENTLLENITLHSALGGTSNAAAIRHEGRGLKVKKCEITNCHNGMLVGHEPDMTVEVIDTHFHHMWTQGDLAHNIYVGKIAQLVVDGCRFEDGESGHFIKTLAAQTRIRYNRLLQRTDLNAAFIDIWGCQDFQVMGNAMMRGGRYGSLAFIQITPRGTVPCPDERIKRGLVAYNTVFFNNDLHDDPRRTELVHYNYAAQDVEILNNIIVHCRDVVWDSKGYGFAANGGVLAGNYHTRSWENDLFVDPSAGDLRLTRSTGIEPVPIDVLPDRQIAYPIGTEPRANAASVGAFCGAAIPVESPVEPPSVDPQPLALPPGGYTLVRGKYEFEVK